MVANGRWITRNSEGMAVALIAAALEWTLILLLLVSGVFSYLIGKFAAFFGLSPPCIVCSRLDHLFEPANGRRPLRDLLCDGHAAEASSLVSEAGDTCPTAPAGARRGEELRCPCCGMVPEDEFYSYLLLDPPPPSAPCCSRKGSSVRQMACNREGTSGEQKGGEVNVSNQGHEMMAIEMEKIEGVIAVVEESHLVEDESMEDLARSLEGAHYQEGLVSAGLVDCTTTMGEDCIVLGNVRFDQECKALDARSITSETCDLMEEIPSRVDKLGGDIGCIQDEEKVSVSDTELGSVMGVNSWNAKQTEVEEHELALDAERVDLVAVDAIILDAGSYSEEENTYASAKEKANGSMELKFPELDGIKQPTVFLEVTRSSKEGSASCIAVMGNDNICINLPQHDRVEKGSMIVDAEDILEGEKMLPPICGTVNSIEEKSLVAYSSNNHNFEGMQDSVLNNVVEQVEAFIVEQYGPEQQVGPMLTTTKSPDCLFGQEPSDLEEERAPETPTSVYGIHGLHKGFLFGRTESVDGSVTNEVESCDSLTLEQLRSTLQAERKALHALYAELEEERSAAAIATNQTMAMINRLQEEKAAMQMEALQYQRMMEEQSEYDQEALQLLNDLLLKRDKEKQELENELEVYRKRVYLYETRERRITMNKITGRCATNSASSAENTDDLSIGFQEGDDYALGLDENHNGPVDDELNSKIDQSTTNRIMTVTESLDNFEQERLSVLKELKALELKLITLEDQDNDDLEDFDNFPDKIGLFSNGDYEYPIDDRHDALNCFLDDLDVNDKLFYERRSKGLRGKRLSPLFDAISNENDEVYALEESDNAPGVEEQKGYNQHPWDARSS